MTTLKPINEMTPDQFEETHIAATQAAKDAVEAARVRFCADNPDNTYGEPMYCGFAWCSFRGVRSNSKLGKKCEELGITKDYSKAHVIWNPSQHHGQSMEFKEIGSYAYRAKFNEAGFEIYCGSRAD